MSGYGGEEKDKKRTKGVMKHEGLEGFVGLRVIWEHWTAATRRLHKLGKGWPLWQCIPMATVVSTEKSRPQKNIFVFTMQNLHLWNSLVRNKDGQSKGGTENTSTVEKGTFEWALCLSEPSFSCRTSWPRTCPSQCPLTPFSSFSFSLYR